MSGIKRRTNRGVNMKINYMLIRIVVMILVFLYQVTTASAEDNSVNLAEAVALSNVEAEKYGYYHDMIAGYNIYDTPWNMCIPEHSQDNLQIKIRNELLGKKYLAIRYKSASPEKEFCIFVDMSNVKVIEHYGESLGLSKEEAIEYANNIARSLGYNLQSMDVGAGKYRTKWNKYLPEQNTSEPVEKLRGLLSDREYWAIYYYPKPSTHGGDVCIFIDALTGETITYYTREKVVTHEEAVDIANKEIIKLGYDLNAMSVETTKYNKPWNNYYPNRNAMNINEDPKNKLNDLEYWVVYCYPKKHIVGGDIWIFIDAISGNIITYDNNVNGINKYQSIDIAMKEAKRLKYDTNYYMMEVYKNTTPFRRKYFHIEKAPDYSPGVNRERYFEKSNYREYWLVYFHPKNLGKDGGLYFYIDSHTGEIILAEDSFGNIGGNR